MRLLLDATGSAGAPTPGDLCDDSALRLLYAAPAPSWLRVNFVSTLDGAATGADGRSGSINTEADFVVFQLLRRLADVVVIGAGTARNEGYPPLRDEDGSAPVLAIVSNSGQMPKRLLAADSGPGAVLLITREAAPAVHADEAREALGDDHVIVAGREQVDLAAARKALEDRGLRQILSEGGPHLLNSMLGAGVVDELDLTWAPHLVGGDHLRITAGPALDVPLEPLLLLEQDGSVIGRWAVSR
jgi:riboflavin biosynthesis pyrimidine reductase